MLGHQLPELWESEAEKFLRKSAHSADTVSNKSPLDPLGFT